MTSGYRLSAAPPYGNETVYWQPLAINYDRLLGTDNSLMH
jgi:hypothetical protein